MFGFISKCCTPRCKQLTEYVAGAVYLAGAYPLNIAYESLDFGLRNRVQGAVNCTLNALQEPVKCCIANATNVVAGAHHYPKFSFINSIAMPIVGFGVGLGLGDALSSCEIKCCNPQFKTLAKGGVVAAALLIGPLVAYNEFACSGEVQLVIDTLGACRNITECCIPALTHIVRQDPTPLMALVGAVAEPLLAVGAGIACMSLKKVVQMSWNSSRDVVAINDSEKEGLMGTDGSDDADI